MSSQPDTKEDQPSTFAHLEHDPRSDTGQDASAEERALLRKIDMRLVPCVWIMYLMSYVGSYLVIWRVTVLLLRYPISFFKYILTGHFCSSIEVTSAMLIRLDRSNSRVPIRLEQKLIQ